MKHMDVKRMNLLVEHKHKGRSIKKLVLKASARPIVIGSNPKSDLRLVGAQVSPFHAVLECRPSGWFIFDFASTTGTWINNESVNELRIDKGVVVKVGDHELVLNPIAPHAELFSKDPTERPSPSILTHHQLVVRTAKGVLESHVLPQGAVFKLQVGTDVHSFEAPATGEWSTRVVGKVSIQQRLIPNPGTAPKEKMKLDNEMRWPVLVSGVFVMVMALVVLLKPADSDVPKTLPDMDNKYATMIYSAKLVKEKKKESAQAAQKTFKEAKGQAGSAGGGQRVEVAKGQAATKLITQVKASNLSALIGKIAKRTSANAQVINAIGVSAEKGGGRAVAAIGSASLGKVVGNLGTQNGEGVRIQGVGTTGKGGGGSYKEGTGLGLGGVGSADVGIIEEEAEVGGGLDKDVIAEVIKSELGQIRYCYEKQLSAHPDLYGKILIRFAIGLDGTVAEQRVSTTTLKNADVEGCILRRIARWKFPLPKGGTSVLVTYPFLFKNIN